MGDAVLIRTRAGVGRARRRSFRRSVLAGAALAAVAVAVALVVRKDDPGYRLWARVGGVPVHWSYCDDVRAVVSTRGAPDGALPLVADAFATWREATGLRVTLGPPNDAPPSRVVPAPGDGADVRVMWYDATDPAFSDVAGSLGVAEPFVEGASIRGGGVWLNATLLAGRPDALRFAVLHELGHVAGLRHVADEDQVMVEEKPREDGPEEYGAGDLAGFAALRAADGGCHAGPGAATVIAS